MRRYPAAAGTLGIVLLALAAGCGGPADAGGIATLEGTATTATVAEGAEGGEVDLEEALLAFAACMREEGIDMPDPELDAEGNVQLVSLLGGAGLAAARAGDTAAMREAATVCRGHLEGVALRFASIDRTEMEDRMLEYAGCMREHGFDLPDPDFTGGGNRAGLGRSGPFPGIGLEVFQDPAFQEANEGCQGIFAGLVPQGGAVPGGG
jgi:hypothetical protein